MAPRALLSVTGAASVSSKSVFRTGGSIMKRVSIAVAALAAILVSGAAISGSDIHVLASGNHSTVKFPATKDFHNQADLDAFMATAFDKGHAPSLDPVDWNKDMVLALFIGYQKYTGYRIRFTNVDASGDAVVVDTSVSVPCSMHARQDDQEPFVIVTVPASTKPVNFNQPVQSNQPC
jgi:hypothetical protein